MVRKGMGHGELTPEVFTQVWEECYKEVRVVGVLCARVCAWMLEGVCVLVYRYKHELQIYCVDGGSVLLVMCCVLASFLPVVLPVFGWSFNRCCTCLARIATQGLPWPAPRTDWKPWRRNSMYVRKYMYVCMYIRLCSVYVRMYIRMYVCMCEDVCMTYVRM